MTAATDPLGYELRELSLGEVLDAGFQLLKNHFNLIVGISFIGQLPTILLFAHPAFRWMFDPFAAQNGDIPDLGVSFFVGLALYLLAMMFLMPFVVAAITSAIGRLYLGEPVAFGDAARDGLTRLVPLVVTYIIWSLVTFVAIGLVLFGLALLFVPLGMVFEGAVAGVLIILGVVVMLPVLFTVGALLMIASGILAAVVVLEKDSLFSAVSRSWSLVMGSFGRAVAVSLTVYIVVAIVPSALQFMVGSLPVIGAVLWGAAQALCQAYLFATAIVLYFDMRCRTESFDLEHLASMIDAAPPSGPTGVDVPRPVG